MRFAMIFLLVFCLLLGGGTLLAQSGGYELARQRVNTGGGLITGGNYSLANVIGQPEAGSTQRGGGYSLNGGIVDAGGSGPVTPAGEHVYLPLVTR